MTPKEPELLAVVRSSKRTLVVVKRGEFLTPAVSGVVARSAESDTRARDNFCATSEADTNTSET
jgi:hypothetical protein